MTTYVFDGTTNLEIPAFRPALDSIIINGVDIADVASFTEGDETVTLTLTSGVVLTLGGVIFSSLTAANFDAAGGSDLVFSFGAAGTGTGNIVVGADDAAGSDTLTASTDGAFIYGLAGGDNIDTNGFVDATIYAGKGDDFVTVDGGLVYGNAGADEITLTVATGETATVFGGSDVVGTTDGNDTIDGSASVGDLLLYGNAGNDTLIGGSGDDTIYGGADNDSILGGAGNDALYGNLGNDTIIGGAGNDTIFGGQDDDTITVGTGNDVAYGNLGDDTFAFDGTDAVTVVGGAGDDSVGALDLAGVFDPATAGVLGAGSVVYGGIGSDVINVEVNTTAGREMTSIFGGNNIVGSDDGDDTITVSGTADVAIFGNAGNDTLVGNDGNSMLFGGQGNDTLTGGSTEGNVSMLTGGEGNDVFVANDIVAAATPTNDIGYSIVTDFTKGSDTIDFSAAVTSFATVTVGAATPLNTVQDVITAYEGQIANNGALAVVIQSGELAGHTVVFADTDGAAGADEVIVLSGVQNTLALSDFS